MKSLFSCLALLSFLAPAALAEGPGPRPESFASRAEPGEVELGLPFVYSIEVRHPPAERYELPDPLSLGSLAIRGVEEERRQEKGAIVTVFSIHLAIYDALGEVGIPDVELRVGGGEGPLGSLRIPGVPVVVRATGEGDELSPLPEPLDVRIVAWERILLPLALAAAAALLLYLFRRSRAASPEAVEPPVPADVRALAELEALRRASSWERGDGRLHYFRLSEILRSYLGAAHGVGAEEMTTDELLGALRDAPVEGLSHPTLEGWLRRGDLIRFAKGRVDPEEALSDLEAARGMILAMAAASRDRAGEERTA